MPLQTVDLDPLDVLRGRWAACSAVVAALGFPGTSHARDGAAGRLWWHDDGGGNTAQLVQPAPGFAVLSGWDHEGSRTALTRSGDGEPAGELLVDVPEWWAAGVPREGEVGFVYGWDGARWQRATYDLPDGFAELQLPAGSDAALVGFVDSYLDGVADEQGQNWPTPRAAVQALGRAGAGLTEADLAAVLGPLDADLAAGVAAARGF